MSLLTVELTAVDHVSAGAEEPGRLSLWESRVFVSYTAAALCNNPDNEYFERDSHGGGSVLERPENGVRQPYSCLSPWIIFGIFA